MVPGIEGFEPYGLTRAFQLGLRAQGRRYSHREVASRLARHPHAGSLLAVADLAPSFGAKIIAVRCDLGDIEPDTVPVMLQLGSGEHLGFAVVIGVTGDRFSLLDGLGVQHLISRSDLDRWAAGVVIFFEDDPGSRRLERAYYLNRLLESPAELGERLSRHLPLFSGTGGLMRLIALALLAAGVTLALRHSFGSRTGLFGTLLAAVVTLGASLSWMLLAVSRQTATATSRSSLSRRLCGSEGLLDCDSVLHSRWAGAGPWTLASLGVAWFLSLLATFAWTEIGGAAAGVGAVWLAFSLLLASPVSLFLVAVQIWPLKKLCTLCMTIHLAVFAGVAAGWPLWARWFPPTLSQLAALWPAGLLQAWLFSLGLGVLMPWLRDREALAELTTDFASATSTPLGALALTLAGPRLSPTTGSSPLSWGAIHAPLVVEAFVNPACGSCGPVLSELVALAQSHSDRVRLVVHLVTKDGPLKSNDSSLLLALLAIASLRGCDAALEALWTIKRDPTPWLREAAAGAGPLGSRLADCLPEEIEATMPAARDALKRAAAMAASARSGLPFILAAGRRFPSAVRHLEALVSDHYPLLLESLGIDRESRSMPPPVPRGTKPPDAFGREN